MKKLFVYLSIFISPHTLPFCVELSKFYDKVVCINMKETDPERIKMGWDVSDSRVEIIRYGDDIVRVQQLIADADDVVLAGPWFKLVKARIINGKRVFLAHERLLKRGILKFVDPRLYKYIIFNIRNRNNRVYLLAIGKYAASDFKMLGFNKEKIFQFAYFPKVDKNSNNGPIATGAELIWVGRMIDWKRPILMLKAFKELPDSFRLTMIGDGILFKKVQKYVEKNKLDRVKLMGMIDNCRVREKMQKASILVSTSNRQEGWGAVINEGMENGCAVVCSEKIGCAKTLAADKRTAVLFRDKSKKSLVNAIIYAYGNSTELIRTARAAIENEYNPTNGASRFLQLCNALEGKGEFPKGLCGKVYE